MQTEIDVLLHFLLRLESASKLVHLFVLCFPEDSISINLSSTSSTDSTPTIELIKVSQNSSFSLTLLIIFCVGILQAVELS